MTPPPGSPPSDPDVDHEPEFEEEPEAGPRRHRAAHETAIQSLTHREKPGFFRGLLLHAPWWTISFATVILIIAGAKIIQLGHKLIEEKEKITTAALRNEASDAVDVQQEEIIEYTEMPDLPEPDDTEDDLFDEGEEEAPVFFPGALLSDHNESDNDEDWGEMKGDSLDASMFSQTTGAGMFDSIGVGSGSKRGKRSFGGKRGGRRNLISGIRRNRGRRASKATEEAVERGLKWLARHQNADGSWSPTDFGVHCTETICEGEGYEDYEVGMTGLALLAFLGAGYHHLSREKYTDPVTGKVMKYGDVVRTGIKYLVDMQDDDGAISRQSGKFHYNHAVATLALTEAYGLTNNAFLKQPVTKALNFLVGSQSSTPDGSGLLGWRYLPQSGDSDVSVTGWCVMAFKSALLSNVEGPWEEAMEGALEFVRQVTNTGGLVGYLSVDDAGQQVRVPGENDHFMNHQAMTAVGMLVRMFVDLDPDDPDLLKGANILVKDLPRWSKEDFSNDYYYWYYGSLALNQYDGEDSPSRTGKYWPKWNQAMKDALVPTQNRTGCAQGSWDADSRWGFEGGRVYTTAINVLTLEVYYRYENAFGVGEKRGGYKGSAKPKIPLLGTGEGKPRVETEGQGSPSPSSGGGSGA